MVDAFLISELSPHLALATQEVPDFFNGSMRNSHRRLTRSQLEVSEASPCQTEQDAHIRTVGRHGVRGTRQPFEI
jgi:hypothetical protein